MGWAKWWFWVCKTQKVMVELVDTNSFLKTRYKYKPQCRCGINPELSFLGVLFQIKFIGFFRVTRNGHLPFPQGSNYDLNHPCKGAPGWHLMPIETRARQEYQNRYRKAQSRKPITKSPTHIVLYVHKNCVSKECP